MSKLYQLMQKKILKIFYKAFVPRSIRKRWHFYYTEIPNQNKVGAYWSNVIKEYQLGNIASFNYQAKQKQLIGRKIIWQYWAQGIDNLPDTAKLCFASVDKHCKDFLIIRLTDDTIKDYIDFPEFVTKKRKNPQFRPVFFSDLLRIALINTYGGVWLDASVLLTDALPQCYQRYNFFMFSRDPNSINKDWGKNDSHFYFSWRDDFKVNHLSSIIFGKHETEISKTLLDLLSHYWQTQQTIQHYFFFQIMINQVKDANFIDFDFPIVDDTLPHLLQPKMNDSYNQAEFNMIINSASIHKLSLHARLKEKNILGHITFYGYLKETLLHHLM